MDGLEEHSGSGRGLSIQLVPVVVDGHEGGTGVAAASVGCNDGVVELILFDPAISL